MKLQLSSVLLVVAGFLVSSSTAAITAEEFQEKTELGFHLLSLAEGADPVWKTEEETDELISQSVNFFDLTYTYTPTDSNARVAAAEVQVAAVNAYAAPSHQAELRPIIAQVSLTMTQNYLNNLTAFNNRYYKAASGQAASVWIRDTIANIIRTYPASGASVDLYPHSWTQNSIVAKIPGKTAGPVTILGSHMDSIGTGSVATSRAPGADDDGSGSVNLIESFRVLLQAGFKPATPVEFHWYAGEEAGLLGSQAIATKYKQTAVEVKGMLQLDMTAYVKPGTTPVVGLMPDYTDANLTSFVGALVDAYTSLKWVINAKCGYGCSDHASWNAKGYPTALPFEGLFSNINPKIHTSGDTTAVSGFSWTHTLEYTKIAAAFAYELAI